MSGKRPPGPVVRWDEDPAAQRARAREWVEEQLSEATRSPHEETKVPESAVQIRYEFLAAGAELAAHLTVAARESDVDTLGRAVILLTRDQLEAAAMAFALLAAADAPVVE